MDPQSYKIYLTRPETALRYGVDERSIARWEKDERLRFPSPMVINGRKFFKITDLEEWERRRVVSRSQSAA